MDLLEYQGKQLVRKHGVPIPEGRHAASVDEAVEAAGAQAAADAILGMDIRGFTVHEIYEQVTRCCSTSSPGSPAATRWRAG